MRENPSNNKRFPLFSPLDIKRLENTFFDEPKKNKKRKPLFTLLKYLIIVSLLGGGYILYSRYTFVVIPKIKHSSKSLLSNQLLNSINLLSKEKKIKFSQGIIYLPLFPNKEEGFILNTKTFIDLNKYNLEMIISFINKNIKKSDLALSIVVRDKKYFSNALAPLKVVLGHNNSFSHPSFLKVAIDFKKIGFPLLNLSQINQIRFSFYNYREEPISLLIKDIVLVEKEVR
ncbi:MAG: hypothetical protein DRP68_03775 [Candidatus Omnitrophota bacterium]|nr:MAG: hypothetical protein DRP68_03775 [Candidatus Omnitrophota bacterium]RKY36376.1 MAG: hypothetical protein DRP72_04175 [Candidatus Omnitrophota bacterium]RKY45891.1 MAG: hypothetical protein DRP81_02385 [Candidatus Omnitrophota bacterium]